ncbi:MAG TPA: hypothetical protein VH165_14620 [Kofleriaceae bacterium]|nr:hypothetical protein [Kofleriaceae bacterium]
MQGFVAQITELARRAAIDTLESAFGGRAVRTTAATTAAAVAEIATASFGKVGRPRGGRGAKRTSADLDALSERFSSFVKANPGLRIEQINKELGTTTKDLALPIRKLISEGAVSAKGQKRSTTYFPGKKKSKN